MDRPEAHRTTRRALAATLAFLAAALPGGSACVDLDPPWPSVSGVGGGLGGDAGASAGGSAGSRPIDDGGAGVGGSSEPGDAADPEDAAPVPAGPPTLTVRWHFDGAYLSWEASSMLVRFEVLRAEGATGELAVKKTNLTAKQLVDTEVTVDTTYRYVVEGETASGERHRSAEVTFTKTMNHLLNASFDEGNAATQTPPSWSTYAPTTSPPGATADYTEVNGGARTGQFHLTHYASGEKNWGIMTYQSVRGLPAGRYGARAFFRIGGDAKNTRLLIKVCGGSDELARTFAPATASTWTEVAAEGSLAASTCYEIGVFTDGGRNAFIHIDDIALYRILP